MKELQAGLQLIKAKCIQLNQHPVFQKKQKTVGVLQQQVSAQQRVLLSFPVKSPLEVLRQRTTDGLKRLEHQAERINQLSIEIEAAMLELKAIASEVNRDWRALQATQKSTTGAINKQDVVASLAPSVCEYETANVPNVQQKQSGSFVLTSRPVDLFKAEREAALLAQTLRRRASRKQFRD